MGPRHFDRILTQSTWVFKLSRVMSSGMFDAVLSCRVVVTGRSQLKQHISDHPRRCLWVPLTFNNNSNVAICQILCDVITAVSTRPYNRSEVYRRTVALAWNVDVQWWSTDRVSSQRRQWLQHSAAVLAAELMVRGICNFGPLRVCNSTKMHIRNVALYINFISPKMVASRRNTKIRLKRLYN